MRERVASRASRVKWILDRLLDQMRDHIAIYAKTAEEQENLPELKVGWRINPTSQETTHTLILDTIKTNPELWSHAIPEGCVIVSKSALKVAGLDDAMIGVLIDQGEAQLELESIKHLSAQLERQP